MDLYLVSGVPGVGKSTLCDTLVTMFPLHYGHIAFGGLIRDVLTSQGMRASESELRQQPAKFVTRGVLRSATEELERRLREGPARPAMLLDSHAVSQTKFGFVATPDGESYFSRLRYSAILVLFADPELVLRRSDQSMSGRMARHRIDLERHSHLLSSVLLGYATLCECPAYFIDASGPTNEVARTADSLIRGEEC